MEYKIRTHANVGRELVEQCRTLPGNRIVYMGVPLTEQHPEHLSRTTVADVWLMQTAMGPEFKTVVFAPDAPEYLPE